MFTQRTHYYVTITYSKKMRFEQNGIFFYKRQVRVWNSHPLLYEVSLSPP